MKVQGTKLKT